MGDRRKGHILSGWSSVPGGDPRPGRDSEWSQETRSSREPQGDADVGSDRVLQVTPPVGGSPSWERWLRIRSGEGEVCSCLGSASLWDEACLGLPEPPFPRLQSGLRMPTPRDAERSEGGGR